MSPAGGHILPGTPLMGGPWFTLLLEVMWARFVGVGESKNARSARLSIADFNFVSWTVDSGQFGWE
jgi:hypothetical protein